MSKSPFTPGEQFEYEGPRCPYCGRQFTVDESYYFDESYDKEECDECGRDFVVSVHHSTTWTTYPKKAKP